MAERVQHAVRYLEDYPVGATAEVGEVVVDAGEIREFAAKYDPQFFHLGDGGGERSPFGGGLTASGWHTCGMVMRMLVNGGFITDASSLGSPGLDTLRWTRPVRPGDTLRALCTIVENRPSRSRDDRGAITFDVDVRNQNDESVMTVRWIGIIRKRPASGPGGDGS